MMSHFLSVNMKRTFTVFAAGFVVVLPVTSEAQGWRGTVRDSAGVEIVENPDEGLWSNTNRWRVEQGLLIGSADGDPDYEFGQIAGIVVSDDGRVFVFDQQAQHIKVFDQDGFFLNTIGQPGGGPGEIAAGAGPIFSTGDTIFVPDLANRRIDRFTLNGDDAGSWVLDPTKGIPARWDVTDDGMIASQIRQIAFDPNAPALDSLDAVVLMRSDGEIVDTVQTVLSGKTFIMNNGVPEFHFFSPEPAWAMGSGRSSYFGVNNEYRIRYYDNDGQLVRIATKPSGREEVTSRDREIFTDFLAQVWTDAGVPEPQLNGLLRAVNFEDHYPAFLQYMRGPDESLWVQRVQRISELTEEEAENFNPLMNLGSADWDVFDSEGRYLGEINMPVRFQPMQFVDNDIYGIWRDEFDVQYVLSVSVVGVTGRDS